jgi:dihydroxyacetone kinase-like predicted kinase
MVLPEWTLLPPGFQVQKNEIISCNGSGFKNLLQAGETWLEAHHKIVNALNVFPVPDGDTGINLVLTMRAAVEAIEPNAADEVSIVASQAAQGALMGARGNSGVILSQFLQGLALGLSEHSQLTAKSLAVSLQAGAEAAYQSVIEPVEGTILTVMRAAAEAAQRSVKDKHNLQTALTEIVEATRQAQATTADLLPVLKQAGVSDAGGQGFLYILEGAISTETSIVRSGGAFLLKPLAIAFVMFWSAVTVECLDLKPCWCSIVGRCCASIGRIVFSIHFAIGDSSEIGR